MQLLRLSPPPTAVFSCNNKMLAGLLRALCESDVLCPAQMSVVGFDDHIWLRAYRPPITTVSQRSHDVGYLAMTMLLSRINETSDKGGRSVTLPCELIVRSSTARPCG
jgi:LacI family transcriptional regulator